MGKKRKRTGKTYYDKERDIYVIDKSKKDMNCTELKFLEMGGYTNIVPDPKRKDDDLDINDWQRRIDKKQAKIEKRNEKMIEEFWVEYFEYLKNPKKYKGKMSKTEKKILKFFNKRAKKDKKNNKEDKELKKAMKNPIDYYIYMKLKQDEEEANELIMQRTGRALHDFGHRKKSKSFKNPNKSFFNRNSTEEYDESKTILLKTIEEELLERLNDESMFDRDNIVVEYGEVNLDKKKKKKKKKDVDRLII